MLPRKLSAKMHLPGLRPSSKTSRKMPAEWCWNHGEKSLPNAGLDFQICVDWWNHGEKSLDFIFRLFFIFLDMCLICGTRGNSSAAISQSLASCGLGRLVTLLCSDISCAVHKQASIVGERLGHVGTCWDMLGHLDFPLTSFRHWYDTCVPHLSTSVWL